MYRLLLIFSWRCMYMYGSNQKQLVAFARLLNVVDFGRFAATAGAFGRSSLVLLLSGLGFLSSFFSLVHFTCLLGMLFLDMAEFGLGGNPLLDVSHRHDNSDIRNHKGDLGLL